MGGLGVLGKSETDISCSLPDRPHCADGAAYKKLTLSFKNPSSKTQIRILPVSGCDPEWLRTEIQVCLVSFMLGSFVHQELFL